MSAPVRRIRLSSREGMFLHKAGFLPDHLRHTFDALVAAGKGPYEFSVTPEVAEDLRDAFTLRLATVGFDSEYELTDEGKLLEELIDRFYGQP